MNIRRFFDTWRLVANGTLGFRGIVFRRKEVSNVRLVVIHASATMMKGDAVQRAQFLNQTPSVNSTSHEWARKANIGKDPVLLQPFMLAQYFSIGSAGRVLLEALPQEVVQERRNCLWNGRFGVFHDAEHDCSHDRLASTAKAH